jgi:hypothetical protein
MDGRHGYRAAQTKDFSFQVSKTASEAKEKPFSLFLRGCFFNTHLKYLPF